MPEAEFVRMICPSCSATMQLPAALAPGPARCPNCGALFADLASPTPGYRAWPPFWQGMAMGALSGVVCLAMASIAAAAARLWGQ